MMLGLAIPLLSPIASVFASSSVASAAEVVENVSAPDVVNGVISATAVPDLAFVDVIEVSGVIDEISADAIERSLLKASKNGSQAVILQLNSRGAVVSRDRMTALLETIKASSIPVAVWVGPSGSRAYGMPAQILAVADVTAMAPGTRIGRIGVPLKVNGTNISFGKADDVLGTQTLGFLEAREQGALKFATDDRGVPVLRNMLYVLDGVTVKGSTLDTVSDSVDASGQVVREATSVRFSKLGLMPRLLHTVASPPSALLLLTVGLALLIFEFFTAGIGIAGVVGATCLILGSLGAGSLPLNGVGLLLLLLSMLLCAVDVQVGVPRVWTGVGIVMYSASTFLLFRSVDGLTMRPSWITLLVCIGGVSLTFVVGMPSMTRTRFGTPTIGRDNLIGTQGVTVGAIDPEGTVRVDGAQWRARTNRATPLIDGQAVRVAAIDGITLLIEPLEGAARDYREMRKSDPPETAAE